LQPHISSMDKPSETSAFLAIILAFLGVSDLTAASMDEGTAHQYWLANVPVRLTFLFALAGYVYTFKPDGVFGRNSVGHGVIGENLQNSLVFAWSFFEIAAWFWVSLGVCCLGCADTLLITTGLHEPARRARKTGPAACRAASSGAGPLMSSRGAFLRILMCLLRTDTQTPSTISFCCQDRNAAAAG